VFGREMPQFNPMRVLRNRVVVQWHDRLDEVPSDPASQPVIGLFDLPPQRIHLHKFSNFVPMRGATTGDFEEMALLSGQGVGLVDSVLPAAEVITRMVNDAATALSRYRPAP
jgi:NAD(P)H-dependent flavin oxidoreductase YrpB (nitropropane dioxygenase family)